MKRGDGVFLPILVMNRLESIWGPDAAEFKYVYILYLSCLFTDHSFSSYASPARWMNLPGAASTVPSVWGNQFSFLSGPRSCIGYRFAVMEYVMFSASSLG